MKKILLLVSPLLAFGFVSMAQLSYDMSKKDYVNMPNDGTFRKTKLAVINNTASSIEFEWRVIDYFIPQGWSDQGFCDWSGCYSLSQTGWHAPFALAANSSDTIYATVARGTMGVESCATVRIEYRQRGMSSQFLELKHSSFSDASTCWPLSIDNIEKELVNVYPNPATERVNLTIVDKSVRTVHLSSILGKQIKVIDVTSTGGFDYQMSLEALPKGIYFLQFKNEGGKIIGVKRLAKN